MSWTRLEVYGVHSRTVTLGSKITHTMQAYARPRGPDCCHFYASAPVSRGSSARVTQHTPWATSNVLGIGHQFQAAPAR